MIPARKSFTLVGEKSVTLVELLFLMSFRTRAQVLENIFNSESLIEKSSTEIAIKTLNAIRKS